MTRRRKELRASTGGWIIAGAIVLFLATGCTSQLQIPKETLIQVPMACLSPADKPQRPVLLTDAEILALDTYRATWALWGDRLERDGYEKKMEAMVEGCARIPARP